MSKAKIGMSRGWSKRVVGTWYIYKTDSNDCHTEYFHDDGVWRTFAIANETSAYFPTQNAAIDCFVDHLTNGCATKPHKALNNKDVEERNDDDNSL